MATTLGHIISDGALHTGVKLLREAADEIEAVAKKQDAALEKLFGKQPKKGGE